MIMGHHSNLYLIRTIVLYIDKLKADFVDNLILSNNSALFIIHKYYIRNIMRS
jgi:hypothetical protein